MDGKGIAAECSNRVGNMPGTADEKYEAERLHGPSYLDCENLLRRCQARSPQQKVQPSVAERRKDCNSMSRSGGLGPVAVGLR